MARHAELGFLIAVCAVAGSCGGESGVHATAGSTAAATSGSGGSGAGAATSSSSAGGGMAMPNCGDKLQNGAETDVDCGGTCPLKCAEGKSCKVNADCDKGTCANGKCQMPATCTDQKQDGTETDVDCGGTCPMKCADGKGCQTGGDCVSGACMSNKCQANPADPNFGSVTLLMHFDGSDGSTSFGDTKGHTVTVQGGAKISSEQSKFGGASGKFTPGSGSYLTLANSAEWNLTSGDSTVEAWFYPNTVAPPSGGMIVVGQSASNLDGHWFLCQSNSSWVGSSTNGSVATPDGVVVPKVWQYLAVVRDAGATRIYLNGVLQVSSANNFYTASPLPLYIGVTYQQSSPNAYIWDGFIDELRITKGVARYKANFTPPTAPFPDH